ncbi:amino acid ABC transporter permease [Rugosimonospora africana]|uniref:Amino acid ABC transporter permease n=1 Tax=Rugosimonospora africana TaxID=556532 RepID=A0A8J3QXR0_9ACTN|nr:amino acid ABC transporter permease [Rugosimonospora africana]
MRRERILFGTLGAVVVLAAWEICADLGVVNPTFSSKPSEVAHALYEYFQGDGLAALKTSAIEFGLGFGLALVVGLLAGVVMGRWRRVEYTLDPLVNFSNSTPRIALVPLFVIWFGIGMTSKVAIIFLSAVLPILMNTVSGVQAADANLLRVARSFCAGELQTFRTVIVPGAVPYVVTGIRLGIGHGLVGMIVAELVSSTAGLGYTIEIAGNNFQTPDMFAAVFVVAMIGVILTNALKGLERYLDRWRPKA